jgi:DNA-binding response OmpR family regulator
MNPLKKRVLLVDDDEQILDSLGYVLRERGYDVFVARDGVEGLACAERDAPDLIVLDVVMPRRSGFLVLERIRQRRVHAPRIIMVTATCEQRHRDFAASHGVDAFIEKPFDVGQLVTKVDLLLASV